MAWNPWTDVRSRHDVAGLNLTFPQGKMPSLFARRIRQHYYAATSYVDDLIGRVLEAAASTSNGRETVVSLISDHGWSLGQHQEWAKYSAFLAANQVRDISVRRFFFLLTYFLFRCRGYFLTLSRPLGYTDSNPLMFYNRIR